MDEGPVLAEEHVPTPSEEMPIRVATQVCLTPSDHHTGKTEQEEVTAPKQTVEEGHLSHGCTA
jgi:hypothetical protein